MKYLLSYFSKVQTSIKSLMNPYKCVKVLNVSVDTVTDEQGSELINNYPI